MVPIYKSRKFWLAVWGLIQTVVLHYLAIPSDIIIAADALVIAVIAGIAYEDGAEKANSG